MAIRSAAVRSSAVETEPRNKTVSRLTLTWMFLLFSPGSVCNFLTIRIFSSCEVSGSVDCSGSALCVGFGAEVSGGNVGGVAPAGVLRGCCATAESDSAKRNHNYELALVFHNSTPTCGNSREKSERQRRCWHPSALLSRLYAFNTYEYRFRGWSCTRSQ